MRKSLLARLDWDFEPVPHQRQRTAVFGVVGAVRVVGEIEVDANLAARVRRFNLQIAARRVRALTRGRVPKRHEQLMLVLLRKKRELGRLAINSESQDPSAR